MRTNKIYNEDCLKTMAKMPENFIDLTVTSPPYDNLRKYNGFKFDWKAVIKELYRVIKIGGVAVWVVGDATIKGSETGTSFKQALYFMECGFNLHDTMIWQKIDPVPENSKRYTNSFEYMFIMVKDKIKKFNPILKDKSKCTIERQKYKRHNIFTKFDGTKKGGYYKVTTKKTKLQNVFSYKTSKERFKHPAIFPEQLANDHIISWSNENDLVYDPFMGSGTTAKISIINNRKWIGSEISAEYCEIIKERIKGIKPTK